MAVTTVQSSVVPFTISTDSGSTYRSLVCKKAWGFTGDTTVNEDESDCGRHVGIGAKKGSFNIEGLYNTTPTSTEISGEELLGLWANGTQFQFKVQYPTSGSPGGDLYMQGNAYLTNYQVSAPLNGLVGFTGTILIDGNVDISA